MQETGINFISVHPRTKEDATKVPARWFMVKKMREVLKIPILGSGDLFTALDAAEFLKFTGANGIIFARGAIHDCEVFNKTKRLVAEKFDQVKTEHLMTDFTQDWLAANFPSEGE